MLQQIYPQVPHSYQYELNKDMQIAAAHYIPTVSAGKCRQVHGHTYFINVTVAGNELDDSGFLVNFQILKKLLHDKYDHTVLNDHKEVFSDEDSNHFPTTEVVARKMWETIEQHLQTLPNSPTCLQIFVRETPTSYCIYRPKRDCSKNE
ncbi:MULTISPECIES: 6-carboxytetrahydropterin synthase QueD [Sutcliffiella]|uniref:6-carboxy-5,6,7,8-tetrahydropterin synthase n=1 Tax=Sutcliffiella cohnii TaxID=33932 RepID=A0A223KPM3_9BACI|nr:MULTISPECIES: 6-carboxytetrahydropterin synthase QueD [Sutcliffiella]AST91451.1 6-carboxytetrahydropterin synthase QueD [Sutcliffiella cohnii]MED4014988.1 6-carboxytetrahydropterin synthase QueD [Sutcliffiella cohnii]WBL17278.1 6-carboxytetrahydropterin synthase QueD [Sutcliffiella sp. NC1]